MDRFISGADLEMWLQSLFTQSGSIDREALPGPQSSVFTGTNVPGPNPPPPQPTLVHDWDARHTATVLITYEV